MDEKNNYNEIQALTAREHVRLRPHLYFQKCFDEKTLDYLPLETACHAIDEVFDQKCDTIKFLLFKDYYVLKYNVGMSLEKSHGCYRAEKIMTAQFACRNEKKHLSVGEEFCELGIATINHVSEYCELTTVSNGQKGFFHFKEGELIYFDILPNDSEKDYTEIILKPDPEIFPDLKLTAKGIKAKTDHLQERFSDVKIIFENHQ